MAILVGIMLFLIIGSFVNPYSPYKDSKLLNSPPSPTHIFGTDFLGRDIYSQIVNGAYPSLLVAVIAALGSVVLGVLAGVFSGYYSRLRGLVGGTGDLIMVFPLLPLLLLIGSLFVATNLFIATLLIFVLWPLVARAIRPQALAISKMPFVQAAKTSGVKDREIVMTIVIPQVLSIAIAYFILNVSLALVLTTALEFLGVGNPDLVSWGSILYWAEQFGFLAGAWWWIVFPGTFITLTGMGFALIGFSLEEVFNPRLRV